MSLLADAALTAGTDALGTLAFWFAVAALLVAAISPIVLSSYNRRTGRRDKLEDEKRDKAQAQAAEMYRAEVAAEAQKVAATLVASNAVVAEAADKAVTHTNHALTEIHTMVNDNLTRAQDRIRELEGQVTTLIDELRVARAREIIEMLTDPEATRKDPAAIAKIITEIGRAARGIDTEPGGSHERR